MFYNLDKNRPLMEIVLYLKVLQHLSTYSLQVIIIIYNLERINKQAEFGNKQIKCK